MKLKSAQVENFKCIHDSTPFSIDPKVTALVGKNESGKTALLHALYKLNPVVNEDSGFRDIEYPRVGWSEYQERKDQAPARALQTTWTLDAEDLAALEVVIGPSARSIQEIVIERRYGKECSYQFKLDEAEVVRHVVATHDFNAQEKKTLGQAGTIAALKTKLGAIQPPTPQVTALTEFLNKHFARGTALLAAIDVLHPRLPKFVYFSEYMRLSGQMSIEDFKANRANLNHTRANEYRMFNALLGLVGKTPEAIEKIDKFEQLQAELEAVSARLSKTIFKYWSQNRHLMVRFRFDAARSADPAPFNSGWVMRTRIENTRHASTTSFDERSTGFVWFFSFLVWFSQMQRNYGKNLIVLLDEPGNSLHAKAQSDLLRYIEEQLAPTYQVVYTTHSPFMIDPTNLLRARTVEDVVQKGADGEEQLLGTRVGSEILSVDRDTTFPLQAALGYEITQTLFVGPHSLLVEGPSDLLYIKWFQRQLAAAKRTTLDPRWTITPCGGVDKVAAFMTLFSGNSLQVAVLVDYKHGDKKKVRSLIESNLLATGHVFTADTFAKQPEADIEDIVGEGPFIELVNGAYGLGTQTLPGMTALPAGRTPQRLVVRAEDHFNTLPAVIPPFDHYAPSEYLVTEGLPDPCPGLSDAMDRFEELFKALNAILPPSGATPTTPAKSQMQKK